MDLKIVKKCSDPETATMEDYFAFLVSFLISSYSAYLSWNCNKNLEVPMKIFYAFFAFIFGTLYLVFYITIRLGNCGLPKQ